MTSSSSGGGGGIGFFGVLFILFLGLKLTGYIDWSWWWITAPLWGPLVVILPIVGIVLLIALATHKPKGRRR